MSLRIVRHAGNHELAPASGVTRQFVSLLTPTEQGNGASIRAIAVCALQSTCDCVEGTPDSILDPGSQHIPVPRHPEKRMRLHANLPSDQSALTVPMHAPRNQ